jgi:hypothetical protein
MSDGWNKRTPKAVTSSAALSTDMPRQICGRLPSEPPDIEGRRGRLFPQQFPSLSRERYP